MAVSGGSRGYVMHGKYLLVSRKAGSGEVKDIGDKYRKRQKLAEMRK